MADNEMAVDYSVPERNHKDDNCCHHYLEGLVCRMAQVRVIFIESSSNRLAILQMKSNKSRIIIVQEEHLDFRYEASGSSTLLQHFCTLVVQLLYNRALSFQARRPCLPNVPCATIQNRSLGTPSGKGRHSNTSVARHSFGVCPNAHFQTSIHHLDAYAHAAHDPLGPPRVLGRLR